MPGLDDVPHTYVFYLFKQPDNFTLPAWDANRVYDPISVYARMNFSVTAVSNIVGDPIAANYFRVVDPNNTATGTASYGTCTFNSTVMTTASPSATYTGLASKLERGLNMAMAAVATAAFAML
jgi:hypothetical protein